MSAAGNESPLPGSGIGAANTTVTGNFYGFQVYSTFTITSVTLAPGFSGDAAIKNIALDQGGIYNLRFTAMTFTGAAMFFGSGVAS